MLQTCAITKQQFEITDEDMNFYQKMGVNPPTLCPEERERRRLAWRNERTLYNRTCDATGRTIISIHHQDKPFPVYENRYWWSDDWDALEYGKDFDFSRPFFVQFQELMNCVPQIAIMNDNGVQSDNCAYCQDFAYGKNCYLVTGTWQSRDSAYNRNCNYTSEVFDSDAVNNQCELAYECCNCQKIYSCAFLEDSANCSNCLFGRDLRGCKYCFGCVNLRQKEYHIFNEPHTREEYEQKIQQYNLSDFDDLQVVQEQYSAFEKNFPRPQGHLVHCEACLGEGVYNCRNFSGYDSFDSEHCKYVDRLSEAKYCYDIVQSGKPQWCLECVTPDESWMTMFSLWCWKSKQVLYSDNCHSSEDVFGCISLRRKKFCILNKQYTEEAYHEMKERIIQHMKHTGEWGEFFPIDISPFAYNETAAMEYYSLDKDEVVQRGWQWKQEPNNDQAQTSTVPDVLCCERCCKLYKLKKMEIDFYHKIGIAFPKKCPLCRHQNRMSRRPRHTFVTRTCDQCNKSMQTVYDNNFPKVFCNDCFLVHAL